MAEIKTALNKQTRAYNELKICKSSAYTGGDSSTSSVVAEKLARIRELEEDILDLQASLDEVSHQLAESRNDSQNNLRTSNAKQKEICGNIQQNFFLSLHFDAGQVIFFIILQLFAFRNMRFPL